MWPGGDGPVRGHRGEAAGDAEDPPGVGQGPQVPPVIDVSYILPYRFLMSFLSHDTLY